MGERAPTDPTRGTGDDRWSRLEGEAYCYLTTVGRRTGRPHAIEIWFALRGPTLYMLSGGGEGSDWVHNLSETPGVSVRIGREQLSGTARLVTDPGEDQTAGTCCSPSTEPATQATSQPGGTRHRRLPWTSR